MVRLILFIFFITAVPAQAGSQKQLDQTIAKMIDHCRGSSDEFHTFRFDSQQFKKRYEMSKIRKKALNHRGTDCSSDRRITSNRKIAKKLLWRHLHGQNETARCLNRVLNTRDWTNLKNLFDSKSQTTILASVHRGKKLNTPEACRYYDFMVYRQDGWGLQLSFDWFDPVP